MQKTARKVTKLRTVNKKFSSNFDVLGSYTGTCLDDKYEKPIQDADDL